MARTRGVKAVIPLSLASLSSNGRTLTIAAADPGQFRQFTAFPTASANEVWKRVAGGEVAVDPAQPRRLEEPKGYLRLGTREDSPSVHIGAYAPHRQADLGGGELQARPPARHPDGQRAARLDRRVHAVGRDRRGSRRLLGPARRCRPSPWSSTTTCCRPPCCPASSVSDAVGTFTYTPHADGTVTPDPSLGELLHPHRAGADPGQRHLQQGDAAAAAGGARPRWCSAAWPTRIHPGEYAGCYFPRYIAYDPAKGLSLHSWGIAVDLNVPGNQRGTVGEMDRQVVAIFKQWGFAWGGDWNYTDPMHFEMAKVVGVG